MSRSANGQDMGEVKKERQRERENQRHTQQIRFDDEGRMSRDFLEGVLATDKLQDNTIVRLQEYVDRTWFLSNLKDAEAWDQRRKLDVMKYKMKGVHPPQESVIQGPIRAFLLDDEDENLQALTAQERAEIDAFFDTLKSIVTRGREGFERKSLNTEVRESRTRSDTFEEDDSGGRFGLF